MKLNLENVTNTQLREAIADSINGRNAERDRAILKRHLIDGITYERLAEEFELSTNHTKYIVKIRTKAIENALKK